MTVSGAVDSLVGDVISGWVSASSGEEVAVVVTFHGTEIVSQANLGRGDFAPNSGRFAFRVQLPHSPSTTDLFNGQLTVHALTAGKSLPLRVWEPLRQAANLEMLDLSGLENAVRFLSVAKRTELARVFGDAKTWKQLKAKKALAVVAYAHDASAWFPYFYNYYGSVADPSAIYIVTPNPKDFEGYKLGGVISIAGSPYDNPARAQMMSRLCQGLQAYYEWTLLCDVDEIVIPHPSSGKSFTEALNGLAGPVSVSRGFDIIQSEGEPDFDFGRPVLAQRRFGLAASGLCKPHLARQPVRWSIGYHFTNIRPAFEVDREGFVTLHLKWACDRIRGEVAQIVQKTAYNADHTAKYALESVVVKRHPGMPEASVPIAPLTGEAMATFESTFLSNMRYNTDEDLWAAEHFVSRNLFEFPAATADQTASKKTFELSLMNEASSAVVGT